MNKVLLVNSNRMKPAVAPIGLDYLASSIKAKDIDVDILDLCFAEDPIEAVIDCLRDSSYSVIGISLRNTDDTYMLSQAFFLPGLKQIISLIRELTPAPIVVGGAGFSISPEDVLTFLDVDLGIWGEGESSFPLLVDLITRGQDYSKVPSLVYRTPSGYARNAPKFLPLGELQCKRGTFDLERYFKEGGQGSIETKRGCNRRCTYCADPLSKGRHVRLRSPQSVASEIERLLEIGVDCLHLCDSEFNLPPTHAFEVCRELIDRQLGEKVRWYTYASPMPFSDELASIMRKAGCVGINFGVDSGNDVVLKELGRDFTSEDLRRNAEICHRQGIVFMYDLLLGGPAETFETLRETIEQMKRLSPDRIGVTLGLRVVPGTEFSKRIREESPLEHNRNLYGSVKNNDSFLAPIFYLNSEIGEEGFSFVSKLIKGDERFLFAWNEQAGRNYNYNDNSVLVEAIKAGHRGAYWDVLRKINEAGK